MSTEICWYTPVDRSENPAGLDHQQHLCETLRFRHIKVVS